jgi:hypothetical protein
MSHCSRLVRSKAQAWPFGVPTQLALVPDQGCNGDRIQPSQPRQKYESWRPLEIPRNFGRNTIGHKRLVDLKNTTFPEPYLRSKVQSSGENRPGEDVSARPAEYESTEVVAANSPNGALMPNGRRSGEQFREAGWRRERKCKPTLSCPKSIENPQNRSINQCLFEFSSGIPTMVLGSISSRHRRSECKGLVETILANPS